MWDSHVIGESAYKSTHLYRHLINWCHNGGVYLA